MYINKLSSNSYEYSIEDTVHRLRQYLPSKSIENTTHQPSYHSNHTSNNQVLYKYKDIKPLINVQVNIQIFRLHKIDSSAEEFTIDFGLTFEWNDPGIANKLKGYYSTHPAVVRHNPSFGRADYTTWPEELEVGKNVFNPAWKILHSSNVEIVKSITSLKNIETGHVHSYHHVQATIHQTLKLHDFPFDSQEIVIKLLSEHPLKVMAFVQHPHRVPMIHKEKDESSEWKLNPLGYNKIYLNCNSSIEPPPSGIIYASIACHLHALRKPGWYINNVFFTTFTIVLSSFSLFLIPPENLSDRLSIIFTTWLMLISLKFIISDRLPKISYVTLLDKYLHASYIVMIVLIIHVCTASRRRVLPAENIGEIPFPVESASKMTATFTGYWYLVLQEMIHSIYDLYCFGVLCSFWIIIHIALVCMYFVKSYNR